ncbi:MAG TPA: right-handed parallel beta-helix repeat-containing protein, partial [Phycisphaerae bacterium]|nr:right-handed parallel beta-helix repeat-containing protein [Phycisphaerae bacterium]
MMTRGFRPILAVTFIAFTVFLPTAGGQTIWYVDAANSPGPGSGTPADPFCRIQDAINAAAANASPPDEIVVADGIYAGTGNQNLDFGGKTLKLRSAGDDPATCIIDCQGSGRGFFFHSGETSVAEVRGFTIRNGSVTPTDPGGHFGGGVYCSSSSRPTLINCTISGNLGAYHGGGIYCSAASPTLTDCTITGNTAAHCGGGLYCVNSAGPTLSNCTIIGNAAAEYGGGLYCTSSNPTLVNCRITANTTDGSGGGVCCYTNSSPTLTNCRIDANTANIGGGVHCGNPLANARLVNCLIDGNAAGYGGAGVACTSSSGPTIVNCTITGNRIVTGLSYGGGLYCDAATPRLANCILWGDMPNQEIYVPSGSPAITYCDVQGGYTGSGNINADPGFAFADDFHLVSGSPCIDAGTNSPTGGLPSPDAEGNTRPLDGNADGHAVADMGAYELNPTVPSIALSPRPIDAFTYAGDPNAVIQTLSIRSTSGAALAWQVETDCPWLSVDPPSGGCQQEIDSISLSIDPTGLAMGDYSCILTVSAVPAANSPQYVPVTFHLGALRHVPSDHATIQGAIDAAAPYDCISVADGVYAGAGNRDLDFQGKTIALRSAGGDPAACIIDCQGAGRGFYFHSGETPGCAVEGFTIRNGDVAYAGGGVACECFSSPTLSHCTFTLNHGYQGGGVHCTTYSNPTLAHCTITGNTASDGGGVFCYASRPKLTDCTISSNTAGGSYSCFGGGLYCSSSSLTLTDCTISGNTITDNYASYGGGMYCSSSSLTLTNCTISLNSTFHGGGVACSHSEMRMINCTIDRNTASGGASNQGGGVHCASSSTLRLTNCTISGNAAVGSSAGYGGGIYCSSSSVIGANSILWGDGPQEIYISAGTASISYSDVQGGWTGAGNKNADPLFTSPLNGIYRLLPAS